MKKFRSMEDVDRANLPEGLHEAVRGTLTTLMDAYAEIGERYNPEVDGHTVLIEQGDTDETIRAAMGGFTLLDAPLEGVVHDEKRQCFITCVLFNNQFGISIVVPDAPWLDPEIRARLVAEI